MNTNESELVGEREAAKMLDISPKTLQAWRWQRRGPNWRKIGRSVKYRIADIEHYIDEVIQYGQSKTE